MGHKRTIRPNAKKLSALFMARHEMEWDTFAKKVKECQREFMGEPGEIKPGRLEFHEYPSTCLCEKPFIDEVSEDGYRPPKLAAPKNLTMKVEDYEMNGDHEESAVLPKPGRRRIQHMMKDE